MLLWAIFSGGLPSLLVEEEEEEEEDVL